MTKSFSYLDDLPIHYRQGLYLIFSKLNNKPPRTTTRIRLRGVLEGPLFVAEPGVAGVLELDLFGSHRCDLLASPGVDPYEEDPVPGVTEPGKDPKAQTDLEGEGVGGRVLGEEKLLSINWYPLDRKFSLAYSRDDAADVAHRIDGEDHRTMTGSRSVICENRDLLVNFKA